MCQAQLPSFELRSKGLRCPVLPSAHRELCPLGAGLSQLAVSHDCLQAFDELHLLKRGGKTTYAGPTGHDSAQLLSYFEAVPGVPPLQPGMNPATWMLEITAFASEERLGADFAQIWAQSGLAR